MELIDRYVHAVGQHLPAPMRADVQAELASLLAESLAERARVSGAPATPELARDVLREFGSPEEVASRYAPADRYLIGPTVYPVFILILKVQFAVIAGISLVFLAARQYQVPGEPGSLAVLGRAMGRFANAAFMNAGVTTLICALIDRAVRHRRAKPGAWEPAALPPVDNPDRVSFAGSIVLLWCLAAVAVVFNLFPEWVGVASINDSGFYVIGLLETGFRRYMPFLNAWLVVEFVLRLVVLRAGGWRRVTRRWALGLEVAKAILLSLIVIGPPVFRYDREFKLALVVLLMAVIVRIGFMVVRTLRAPVSDEPWRAAPLK
jgi:hypothetical protein